MKKNGFTLVELLAVLIILAVLAVLTTVTVSSIISDSENKVTKTQEKNIEEAAKAYYLKEGMSKKDTCISVSKLIKKGYIEGESVLNPKTSEPMNGFVNISYESNQYSYNYQEDTCETCVAISGTGTKVGDKISCRFKNSTENFYVVEYDGTNIQMLAEYNLDVGNIYKSGTSTAITNPTGLQNEKAKAWVAKSSEYYGVSVFSANRYWPVKNEVAYPYIYNNNATIYAYVENYVKYLNDNGVIDAKGNLISYEQLEKLGCSGSSRTCKSSNYPWVYSTSYWTGNLGSEYYIIWGVFTDKTFNNYIHTHNYYFGVRPLITISVDDNLN